MKNVLCSHFLNAVVVTALLLATGCVSSEEQGGADAGFRPALVPQQ